MVCPRDYGLRVRLDPEKLVARSLNASEVLRALEKQKEAGEVEPEKLLNLILKADDAGQIVWLKDVAQVEFGAGGHQGQVSLDGKAVAALGIQPTGEVR